MTHLPPHGESVHCATVGTAVGVGGGVAGMQVQAPVASISHAPKRLGNSGHRIPGWQFGPITHFPPHGTSVHCAAVGTAVGVGGGDAGTQLHASFASSVQVPRRLTISGHGTPGGQFGPIMHFPPQVAAAHCPMGVGGGHSRTQR
ncbi:MAG TPA: hypothetical protein VMT89_18425 [Candidatus Acidoferrales bacterium]|nr:hypothetical protein [Candidatus Acidoferrales bacterium]